MRDKNRVGYLDGLKAIATFVVFNIHFLNAYYCGIYTLDARQFHTKSGVEWWIGATPLNLVYAGKVGARLFLAISAFLLVYHFYQKKNRKKLLVSSLKKYVRLAPPILLVNLAVCAWMRMGAYYNARIAALVGSQEHFGVYNQFEPSVWEAVKEALFGCFLTGSNRYNGPIWFIQYEFLGCLGLAMVTLLIAERRIGTRMAVYILLSILLIRTDYLAMVLAAALADLVVWERGQKENCQSVFYRCLHFVTDRAWMLWLLLLASLYFLTYPSYGLVQGTIYEAFPPKVLFYYNVAIPVLLFCVIYSVPVQRMLDKKVLSRFTSISYFFYLIHFPMIATLSAAFFYAMYERMNYHILAALTYVLSFTASVLLAWMLTKWVDRPVQRLADRVEEKLIGRG